jgi:hypothetical protein
MNTKQIRLSKYRDNTTTTKNTTINVKAIGKFKHAKENSTMIVKKIINPI